MTEIDEVLTKLSLSTSADKLMESLRFLHEYFQSGKGDATEVAIETDILMDLSNIAANYPDNKVKIESLSLLTVISLNSCWSDPFALDVNMSVVSNMLDDKNIVLSSKVIQTAQQVLEAGNVASQSLTSFTTLIYSIMQLLQSPEIDEQEREKLLKSLLFILDKYDVGSDKKGKEKDKKKGKGGKEKEKEKGTTSSSASSSSSSAPAAVQKKIAPPLPVALAEIATVVGKYSVEGGVFVRSHAGFILQIIRDKFKVKVNIKGAKKHKSYEDSDGSDDEREDEEDDDNDDDDLPQFSATDHGPYLTLSDNNHTVTSNSAQQTAFIKKNMSEGIHKFTFSIISSQSYVCLQLGAVKKDCIQQAKQTAMSSIQERVCWYLYNQTNSIYTNNTLSGIAAMGTTAMSTTARSIALPIMGAGAKNIVGMEYNADEHTLGYFLNGRAMFSIKNVPKKAVLGASVLYGTLKITKYEVLDEPTFPKKACVEY